MEPLAEYHRKRRFDRTPEPAGSGGRAEPAGDASAGSAAPGGSAGRFVVQEHHATALHWDVRFERHGVAPSFAVPKGLPRDPRRNHLAVRTEDHPVEYLEFEGEIPEDEYGGGWMRLWDRGTYDCERWDDQEVKVVLHGGRVSGRYAFIRTGGRGGRDWLVHRMDPPAEAWDPRPGVAPVEPRVAEALPEGGAWVVEPWWPGRRLLLGVEGGRPVAGTPALPELRRLAEAMGSTEVAIDLVLVSVGGSPEDVDRRLAATGAAARRLASSHPLTPVAVDLLWHDGEDLVGAPLHERRSRLEAVAPRPPGALLSPQADLSAAPALLEAARTQGLRGVVAKPPGSSYDAGAGWLAVRA